MMPPPDDDLDLRKFVRHHTFLLVYVAVIVTVLLVLLATGWGV